MSRPAGQATFWPLQWPASSPPCALDAGVVIFLAIVLLPLPSVHITIMTG